MMLLPHLVVVALAALRVSVAPAASAAHLAATPAVLSSSTRRAARRASVVLCAKDFSPLLPVVKEYCRPVVLLGESADDLKQLLDVDVRVVISADMKQAVAQVKKLAVDGDVVLLSPACASFDMFENYQQRGNIFAQAVTDLSREAC